MGILAVATEADEVGGAAFKSTTAGMHDALYASESIAVTIREDQVAPFAIGFEQMTGTDMWFHFQCRTGTTSSNWQASYAAGAWFQIYSGNTMLAQVDYLAGRHFPNVYGDTTGTTETRLAMPLSVLTDFDFRLSYAGGNILFEEYMGGTLVASAVAANTGNKPKPTHIMMEHADIINSTIDNLHYSQMIVTEDEPTIGWKVGDLKPNGAGFHTGWQGGFAELADQSRGSRISSDTAGQRESWTLSAYGGPSSSALRGLVARSLAQKGSTGPQKLSHSLRIGGVDYDATAVTPNGIRNSYHDWAVNPATGLVWSTADLAALEAGVLSVAA